ncbi:MAG: hypothetical protein QF570_15560 [Myxococcota bacterium]|jgi:hypothetical protein|nr:hypothetical protein [Myxococcota bacterium]
MTNDIFKARERAFESVYFAKTDAEKIEAIHRERETQAALERLSAATGIHDHGILERLLSLEITSSSIEALSHAPLVAVAWANGDLEPGEKKAALEALAADGVEEGSPAYERFERWLEKPPADELMEVWRDYVHAVLQQLDPEAREGVRKDLIERAERIARAAGGVAGFGAVSKKERGVLGEIVSALSVE